MRNDYIIKINARGGIFTPNGLLSIVESAFKANSGHINFGPRQEIFLNVHKEQMESFVLSMENSGINYEIDNDFYPNIVSSYPAEGIFSGDYWLSEGIYKDILDQFDFQPRLKINIVDNDQCLVPFFNGELNFIASGQYNYWYLFLNFKTTGKVFRWNKLIYSTDIAKISREIEELYLNNSIQDLSEIMELINSNSKYLSMEIDKELSLPRFIFPYYEGMNRYGNKFWLGIYSRDFHFSIAFILELCLLCSHTKIGQLCITPWRTLLIKGIDQKDRILWEKLLGKHDINLRHSSNELNWIVEDINSSEIDLKNYIVNKFNQLDVRTFGLVFGIKLESENYISASVIIEKKPLFLINGFKFFNRYDIYHTEDFNPNGLNKILFYSGSSSKNVYKHLLDLCKKYYAQLNENSSDFVIEEPSKPLEKSRIKLFQCIHCHTVYDERYGDNLLNIKPGIAFTALPSSYQCPTCEAPKNEFKEILEENLINT